MAWKFHESGISQGERWFILYDYFIKHTSKTHPVSRSMIYDYLWLKWGITITDRTFYSDLGALGSDIFGLQIKYDRSLFHGAGGYYIENPQFEPYELRYIIDSVQSSKFLTQATANRLSKKIKAMACEGDAATMNRNAVVANRIRNQEESIVKEADRIFEAINADCQISFLYFHRTTDRHHPKAYTNNGKKNIVSPFSLLWSGGNYYLYAYDGKKFRTYRIDRMENIRCLATEREGGELYNAKALTHQKAIVFDMYHEKEYTVKFRCQNRLADAVIDRFGDSIMLIPDGDNHFTFSAPIEVSPPFFAWVATFGRSIRITDPPAVIDGMKEFLKKSAEMYENE